MFKYISISSTHIDGDIGNPFAKIWCNGRKLTPTICNGICGNCKKERITFFESDVQKNLVLEGNNPKYGPGADHELPADVKILEQAIRMRITSAMQKIEQKKRETVGLERYANERMRVLALQALSPDRITQILQ